MSMTASTLNNEKEVGSTPSKYPTQELLLEIEEEGKRESPPSEGSSVLSPLSSIHATEELSGDAIKAIELDPISNELLSLGANKMENEQPTGEPFSIPSSPIDNRNDQSLTMMNSAYLDQTLLLEEDNGEGKIQQPEDIINKPLQSMEPDDEHGYTVLSDLIKKQNEQNQKNSMLFTTITAKELQGLSKNHQHPRAPSSIISDSTSNTSFSRTSSSFSRRSRLRRPRPWDDEPTYSHQQEQHQQGDREERKPQDYNTSPTNKDGCERTPLLQMKHKSGTESDAEGEKKRSLWSAKTCKRKNTNTIISKQNNMMHQNGDDETKIRNTNNVDKRKQNKHISFPFLRWKRGASDNDDDDDGNNETRSISMSDNVHYGSICSNQTKPDPYGTSIKTEQNQNGNGLFFPSQHEEKVKSVRQQIFLTLFLYAMIMHFVLMAGYGLLLSYRSYRLGDDGAESAITTGAIPWTSVEGRIYNPAIGPNSVTLHLFGVFNPGRVLLLSGNEWWRMITSLTMNTSSIQLGLNACFVKYVLWDLEERYGSKAVLFIYFLSALSGGIACALMASPPFGNGEIIQITGLASAGVTGIIASCVIESAFNGGKEASYNRLHHPKHGKKSLDKTTCCCGYRFRFNMPIFCLFLQILISAFLPYTSLGSVVSGAMMGISCGIFFFATILRDFDEDWDGAGSYSTINFADMESAFEPIVMNTPPRRADGNGLNAFVDCDMPPPPPSSSSKGADTPIMRRSILTSPEEEDDDEFGLLENLYPHGVGGIKNRHPHNSSYFHQDAGAPILTPKKGDGFSLFKSGGANKVGTLRLFGVCLGFMLLGLPGLFIGAISEPINKTALSDSYYGCKTMSGIYYSSKNQKGDNMAEDDNGNSAAAGNSDLVCGEVCIPLAFIHNFEDNPVSNLTSSASCTNSGYPVLLFNDAVNISGDYDVVREVYGTS